MSLLVIRSADLVVIGVETAGCEITAGTIRATEDGASLTLTFPPQSMTETKVAGASIQGARLSGTSTVTCTLTPGTTIPLDVDGLLATIAGLPVTPGNAKLEIPFGLVLSPETSTTAHIPGDAGRPLEHVGSHGLWQLVLADHTRDRLPLLLHPDGAMGGDGDVHPLDAGQRASIVATAAPAAADRLRLSALGGTLTSQTEADGLAWDHDTALGRDQRVRFAQSGVLYPFGHRASMVETAERRVEGGTAFLHRESVLKVLEPVRVLAQDGSRASRAFPFGEVELLTTQLTGVTLRTIREFTRPPDVTDVLEQERQSIRNEALPAAREAFDAIYPSQVPTSIFGLETTLLAGDPTAARLATVWADLTAKEQELADFLASLPPDPVREPPPDPVMIMESPLEFEEELVEEPPPPAADSTFDIIQRLSGEIAALKAEEAQLRPAVQALVDGMAFLRPLDGEDAGRYIVRLAGLGVGEAQGLQLLADRLAQLDALFDAPKPPTVSQILAGDQQASFTVRCAGRLGDVAITTPLLFVHELHVPADAVFGGYDSLSDSSLVLDLDAFTCPLPGVPVDLARRPGAPRSTDIQEVHAVTIRSSNDTAAAMRPVLDRFAIELPELRTLLPSLTGPVTASLTSPFLDGGETAEAIRLDPPVAVDFDGAAERGGGLLVPSFTADVISEEFGPTDRRSLPDGGGDPMAALARMKLFGIPLRDLLGRFDVPPAILQLMDGGVPRGVQFTWPTQVLKSSGPFVAHPPEPPGGPDTTTLDLRVEQTLSTRTTQCRMSAFSLSLPSPDTEIVVVSFGSLAFLEGSGRPPTLEVHGLDVGFAGVLNLLKDLEEKLDLGGSSPHVDVSEAGIRATYDVRIDDASAGAFLIRNIAVLIEVEIPFREGVPSVRVAFASPEAPFQLSVPPFGGGGYLQIEVDGSGLKELSASLEFGGMIGIDFGVVAAEVHALGGVSCTVAGSEVVLSGFLHLGGSVSIFGLVSVSIELRVELVYDSAANQLAGRATLVIEIDVTLYADSVEFDSGLWVFAGGSSPAPPPNLGAPAARDGWAEHQGAYA